MQPYALSAQPAPAAGFPVMVKAPELTAALRRAVLLFQGQTVSVGVLEGKGPHWLVVTGTVAGCYASGFLLDGLRYRTFINWLDVWTGHAVVQGELGAALARTQARLSGLELEHATST